MQFVQIPQFPFFDHFAMASFLWISLLGIKRLYVYDVFNNPDDFKWLCVPAWTILSTSGNLPRGSSEMGMEVIS